MLGGCLCGVSARVVNTDGLVRCVRLLFFLCVFALLIHYRLTVSCPNFSFVLRVRVTCGKRCDATNVPLSVVFLQRRCVWWTYDSIVVLCCLTVCVLEVPYDFYPPLRYDTVGGWMDASVTR